MRKNWDFGTLADVVNKGSSNISLNKIKEEKGEYPLYGAKGFVKNVSFFQQEKEYLGIIKDGAGVGRVSKHPANSSILATMQYIIPKAGFDIDFIYYFLNSIDFEKHRNGSTIPHIYFKDYKSEAFPLLKLPEQKRIVSKLDKAFAAIDKAKANAEQNLNNAKELFESYLENSISKGKNLTKTTLKNEIDLVTGFAFKSKGYTENPDDIFLLRGDNIMQGYLRLENIKRWPKKDFDTYSKFKLQVNDIVLAMDRPWVTAGLKCAKLKKEHLPGLLLQRTACLRNKNGIDNTFLFYLIKSRMFMRYLVGIQTGIGVPHISGKQIQDFSFFKPSLEEQRQISSKCDSLYQETQHLEKVYQQKIINLEELKKSILQKAFNGEL